MGRLHATQQQCYWHGGTASTVSNFQWCTPPGRHTSRCADAAPWVCSGRRAQGLRCAAQPRPRRLRRVPARCGATGATAHDSERVSSAAALLSVYAQGMVHVATRLTLPHEPARNSSCSLPRGNHNALASHSSVLADAADATIVTTDTRKLGLIVARGTAVTVVAPSDGTMSIENPFQQAQQEI